MQLKHISKERKQSISEDFKRRKVLNYLQQYIEDILIPHIKKKCTHKDLVEQVESY